MERRPARPLAGLKNATALAADGDRKGLGRLLASAPELALNPRLVNEAALHGQHEVVALLIEKGASPDGRVPSHEGYRPLHRAIEHRGFPKNPGHLQSAKLLLEAGASTDLRATWMQLPALAVAGMAGDAEMETLLRKAGAKIDLFTAAILGDQPAALRFLGKTKAACAKDANGMTVLHYTALSGFADRAPALRDIALALLDAGADGDAREDIGPYRAVPVLHFAAWKNLAVAEVLLGRGCDPNFGFGNCLWREPGKMAELFLAHGADPNGREPSGQPYLNSRIHWNLASVALWLLKNGADPNLEDAKGNTALHEAAQRGINPGVVEAILAAGGRKTSRNHEGKTALDLARLKKRERLVPLLE